MLTDPARWLLGTAGFMLRGGVFVLLVPLIALPSPVEIRLLLGEGVGSIGFSTGLIVGILGFAVATTLLVMAALYGVAWLELWAFERARRGATPLDATVNRRQLVTRVYSVQTAALCVLAVAAVPLALGAINVAYHELVTPTGSGPLYERVLAGVQVQVLLLVVAAVVVEAVSAILTRRVLRRAYGLGPGGSSRIWRPAVAALGWLVSLALLAPALWLLGRAWQQVRAALGTASSSGGPEPAVILSVVLALGAVWAATLVMAGFASALRGALWSMQELR